MPIRSENIKLYPGGSIKSPEWLAIRAFIRSRAGDCCEGCGVHNYWIGVWTRVAGGGEFFLPVKPHIALGAITQYGKVIQIVCTVAHVDHDVTHNHETNLRFWCQRCHNRHDAKHRQANRRSHAPRPH